MKEKVNASKNGTHIREVQKDIMENDIKGYTVKVKRKYSERTRKQTKSKMRDNLRK